MRKIWEPVKTILSSFKIMEKKIKILFETVSLLKNLLNLI